MKTGGSESLFLQAGKELGFEPEDEEALNSLDPSKKEDIVKFTKEVGEVIGEQIFEGYIQKSPLMARLAEHIANGGDDKSFQEALTSSNKLQDIELTAETPVDDMKALMTKLLGEKGLDADMVNTLVSSAIESDKLFDKTKALYDEAKAANAGKLDALKEKQKAKAEQAKQDNIRYWKGVETQINTGSLGGLNIPEGDRKSFYEWLALPVNRSNQSQSMIEFQKMSEGDRLALDYLRFKAKGGKLDLSKLAENMSTTKSVKSILKKKESADGTKFTRKGNKKVGLQALAGIKPDSLF